MRKESSLISLLPDLRQDMLTLQLIKIMDKMWQNEGLDLGLVLLIPRSTSSMAGGGDKEV